MHLTAAINTKLDQLRRETVQRVAAQLPDNLTMDIHEEFLAEVRRLVREDPEVTSALREAALAPSAIALPAIPQAWQIEHPGGGIGFDERHLTRAEVEHDYPLAKASPLYTEQQILQGACIDPRILELQAAVAWLMIHPLGLDRPSWGTWFMRIAYVTAQRATCRRKRVGALIVDDEHRIISGGYNGAPRGLPDCLTEGCDVRTIDGRESCVRTLHAESNALDFAGPNAEGCTLYTTVIPCRPCALRIIQARVAAVYYGEFYESQGTRETAALLESAGVRLLHLTPGDDSFGVAVRTVIGEKVS